MKKILLSLLLIAMSSFAFSQTIIGGQIGYGTEAESFAVGVNGEIFVHEKVSVAPSFNFYFPKSDDASYSTFGINYSTSVKTSFWELNADAHYYFTDTDAATAFYGLAGLNLLGAKAKITMKTDYPDGFGQPDEENTNSESDTEVGLNLGVGANFNLDSLTPFAELKYETAGNGQLLITAGLRFKIRD